MKLRVVLTALTAVLVAGLLTACGSSNGEASLTDEEEDGDATDDENKAG